MFESLVEFFVDVVVGLFGGGATKPQKKVDDILPEKSASEKALEELSKGPTNGTS